MKEMNERISTIIEASGIKKTVFADRLNVSQAFVSQLCSGVKQPSDRTIADICREFNVNEDWLRTGEGEMLKDEDDSFRRQLVEALAQLDEKEWEVLAGIAKKLTKKD